MHIWVKHLFLFFWWQSKSTTGNEVYAELEVLLFLDIAIDLEH